jgi:hypothetical protein
LLEAGAKIAMNWPHAWISAMRKHRKPIEVGQVQRVTEAWPRLPVQIKRLPDASWRSKIWDAVNALVSESHCSASPLVGRNPRLNKRAPTQKAIADALGIGIRRLHATLARIASSGLRRQRSDADLRENLDSGRESAMGCAAERRGAGGRVRRVIPPLLVARLVGALDTYISVRGAATLLGCGRGRVGALVHAGVLRADGSRLLRSEVEALRDRVLARAWDGGKEIGSLIEREPLERVLRLRVPSAWTKAFVDAIDSGQVRVFAAKTASNWRGVDTLVADVVSWSKVARTQEQETVSLGEAARALAIKEQVAYDLANRGWLPTINLRVGRRSARRVSRSVMQDFALRYMPLNTFTLPEGIHAYAAFAWATAQGLKVVTGPKIDGARQYFVERPAVPIGQMRRADPRRIG